MVERSAATCELSSERTTLSTAVNVQKGTGFEELHDLTEAKDRVGALGRLSTRLTR